MHISELKPGDDITFEASGFTYQAIVDRVEDGYKLWSKDWKSGDDHYSAPGLWYNPTNIRRNAPGPLGILVRDAAQQALVADIRWITGGRITEVAMTIDGSEFSVSFDAEGGATLKDRNYKIKRSAADVDKVFNPPRIDWGILTHQVNHRDDGSVQIGCTTIPAEKIKELRKLREEAMKK